MTIMRGWIAHTEMTKGLSEYKEAKFVGPERRTYLKALEDVISFAGTEPLNENGWYRHTEVYGLTKDGCLIRRPIKRSDRYYSIYFGAKGRAEKALRERGRT